VRIRRIVVTYRTRVAAAVIGLASVGAFAAACGGSSGGTGQSDPGGGNPFQAYANCLSQHGVTIQVPSGGPPGGFGGVRPSGSPRPRPSGAFPSGLPGGGPPGGGRPGGGLLQKPAGVDDATWQAAQAACAAQRPSLGPGGRNNGADNAYRDCLSRHGVTQSAGPGRLNPSDPAVAAAQSACAVLRPTGAPSGSG
jgi:hypothetical protein